MCARGAREIVREPQVVDLHRAAARRGNADRKSRPFVRTPDVVRPTGRRERDCQNGIVTTSASSSATIN